ncbi:MAG: Ig-like domain-containing protein [Bacteroidales bacterium]|nr:Ig-like domain-containing protein [Bacteroidales bacterium]
MKYILTRSKRIVGYRIWVGLVLILNMCANPVTPEGGPKDTTAPGFEKAEPPMYTTKFDQEKIRIYFDEFVQLKDLNNELIISPPVQVKPEIKTKGKSVEIELREPLLENTTYSFFLGNAIVDITENNPVQNFLYVLSTGDVVDSLSIRGNVYNAFTNEPQEGVSVLLYLDNNDTISIDSLPYAVKPYFMSRTDKSGDFNLTNLPNKEFKIFALHDQNSNLIFDQLAEGIAFQEQMIKPYYIAPAKPDTSDADSTKIDSTNIQAPPYLKTELALFIEKDTIQRLIKAFLLTEAQLVFIFKLPVKQLEIRPLNLQMTEEWKLEELNRTKDTLTYWLLKEEQDSIRFEVSEGGLILDTVNVEIIKEERGRRARKEEEKPKYLDVKFNITGGHIDLNKNIQLKFAYPLKSWNMAGSLLIENEDTLKPQINFTDSLNKIGFIEHKLTSSASYSIVIPDSAFYDILGHSHDSIVKHFTTKSIEDYGNLYVDIQVSNEGLNHIIQISDDKKLIEERILTKSEKLSFEFLNPGPYTLKVIYDYNNNGKWDTGDYLNKIQPEKVDFFPAGVAIRANWDIQETWKL